MKDTGIERVKETFLPTGLFVKSVVEDASGKPAYVYEDWLLELVNECPPFMGLTGGERFQRPASEAHGEDDAISNRYCLDFKLVLGQSMTWALRETATQKIALSGVTLTRTSRSECSKKGIWLHRVLRECSSDDLRRLWDATSKQGCLNDDERDVFGFLKTIRKRKNLLLLHPCALYADGNASVSAEQISDMVCSDFEGALSLRRDEYGCFDSYVAYFTGGMFEVMQFDTGGWHRFGSVPVRSSPTLMELAGRYDVFDREYEQLRILLGEK